MPHGQLEQIAEHGRQQLGSMEGVCSALLTQVGRISAQLAQKEDRVAELRGLFRAVQ